MTTLKRKKMPWHMLPVIFSLAWPTMLEELFQTAVQYIDTAMVGSLGTTETAAVGSTSTVNWLVSSTISAIGVGFLAYIAQARGDGNDEAVKRASSQAVLVTLLVGSFFTVVTLSLSGVIPKWMQVDESLRPIASRYFFVLYTPMLARTAIYIFGAILRAGGDSKTPMRVGIWVNIVNVVGNLLLIYPTRTVNLLGAEFTIYGAGMGVIGAAAASAISYVVGGVGLTISLFRHPNISPKGYSIKPDMQVLRACLKVALPNALQRFCSSFGYVAFASMINSLNEISIAAHTVANTVESAFYIPGYGMQAAAATLAGNALGAKDKQRLKDLASITIFVEFLLMLVSGSLLFVFAPSMAGIFSSDPAVISLGSTVLRMVAVSEPFYGVSIVLEGMLLGMGCTTVPFFCNVSGMWCIRILGTFIFTQRLGFGLEAAWACMICHNLYLCLMFNIYWFSGRWTKLMESGAAEKSEATA